MDIYISIYIYIPLYYHIPWGYSMLFIWRRSAAQQHQFRRSLERLPTLRTLAGGRGFFRGYRRYRDSIYWYLIYVLSIYIYGYGSIPINSIFRGLFTSINPSDFDVNYRGFSGFAPLPRRVPCCGEGFWARPLETLSGYLPLVNKQKANLKLAQSK